MPIIEIPSQETKKFIRPSRGEVFGNLFATRNINLISNKGKIRLSERLYRVFDEGDDADFEVPVKFLRVKTYDGDEWWALCQGGATSTSDGQLFKTTGTDPLTGWEQVVVGTWPNTSTDYVDDMGDVRIIHDRWRDL